MNGDAYEIDEAFKARAFLQFLTAEILVLVSNHGQNDLEASNYPSLSQLHVEVTSSTRHIMSQKPSSRVFDV